jgi:YHS domain-containing protein
MKGLLLIIFLIGGFGCVGQTDAVRLKAFNIKKSVAFEGFDPVSYFDRKPVEGNSAIRTTYKGIVYQFSSQANLSKFKLAPDKYEPAYGGWCAFAMGDSGEKVKIDPETYKIIDGKVYLFYNFWGNNTLEDWNKNEKALRESGDRNWNKIVQ